MAPTKLTDADKTAILGLYRQPEETTSTLAERYGVSNSTISRLLKASLPADEYKALIQQKRGTPDRSGDETSGQNPPPPAAPTADSSVADAPVANNSVANDPTIEEATPETLPKREAIKAPILKKRDAATEVAEPAEAPPEDAPAETAADPAQGKPVRRRSRAASDDGTQLALDTAQLSDTTDTTPEPDSATDDLDNTDLDKNWTETTAALGDDYDDDDDEESDDDDEEEGDYDGDSTGLGTSLEVIEVYPLTSNALPVPCYLVVERISSELVALPLKTFASLGQIPEAEGELRTLPVFDNHRIARRFSRRNQRVIKVPDGNLLQTTSSYLQAKGITRLLIDGQVFALDEQAEPIGAAT